ncbi:hypothetical protein DFJ73DRAFT_956113 [Zopfochytrium polystomum]|nr:hypothetical protein DFJ73DRAFT_956113 [Zopfochytrium polystomum]
MAPPWLTRLVLLVGLSCSLLTGVTADAFNCVGGTVYIVAHPDDDLLFQSPDLANDVAGQNCVTTVFLTSGSADGGLEYAECREIGNEKAYALMANVGSSNDLPTVEKKCGRDDQTMTVTLDATEDRASFGGQNVIVRTLALAPTIQRVFFRLPDGNRDGSGFASTGLQSLQKLYFGDISTIDSIDGVNTWTVETLKQALAEILTARSPERVRVQDFLRDYNDGDHSDHLTTARLGAEAAGTSAPDATLTGYMDYPIQDLAADLDSGAADVQIKANAFFAYTPFDKNNAKTGNTARIFFGSTK